MALTIDKINNINEKKDESILMGESENSSKIEEKYSFNEKVNSLENINKKYLLIKSEVFTDLNKTILEYNSIDIDILRNGLLDVILGKIKKIESQIDDAFINKIKGINDEKKHSEESNKTSNKRSDINDSWWGTPINKDSSELNTKSNTVSNLKEQKYSIFLEYLDFKWLNNNSDLYDSIKINLKFIKENPFLTTYNNKSIKVLWIDYTYWEFLETFIDNNINNIIKWKEVRYVPNDDNLYNNIHTDTDILKSELKKDKELDETFYSLTFAPIDNARDKIRDINKIDFDDLYENLNSYLKIDYIDTDSISDQINTFVVSSVWDWKNEWTFAKYLKENKQIIIDELKQSKSLFDEYRKWLLEVKSILDSYEWNVPDEIKQIAEEEIKLLVSWMILVNWFHSIDFINVIDFLANNTTLAWLSEYLVPIFWPALIIWISVIGNTSRLYLKQNRKSKFFNTLNKAGNNTNEDKWELKIKEKIKWLFDKEFATPEEVHQMIKDLSDEWKWNKIKQWYEYLNDIYGRLKKFRDIQQIIYNDSTFEKIQWKLDLNSIFLSDKEFARDIISQIIKNDTWLLNKIVNNWLVIPKMYFWLWALWRLADLFNLKPMLLWKNNIHFKGVKATNGLDDFITDNSDKISNNFDPLKEEKKVLKDLNKELKPDYRIDNAIITKLSDKNDINNLNRLFDLIIKIQWEIEANINSTYVDTINKVLKDWLEKATINIDNNNVSNGDKIIVDRRIIEIIWKIDGNWQIIEKWEIASIKEISKYIDSRYDWLEKNVIDQINVKILNELENETSWTNIIDSILNKLEDVKNIKVENIYTLEWKVKKIDNEATLKRIKDLQQIKISELKNIIGFEEHISNSSSKKTAWKTPDDIIDAEILDEDKILKLERISTNDEIISKWNKIEEIYYRAILNADLKWDTELSNSLISDYSLVEIKKIDINELENNIISKYSIEKWIPDIKILNHTKEVLISHLENKGFIKKVLDGYEIVDSVNLEKRLNVLNKPNFIKYIIKSVKTWG